MTDSPKPETGLHCFGDGPAPPQVADGWKLLLGFPKGARDGFWNLLGIALMEPSNPKFHERLEAFCREHALAEKHAVAAIKACDILIRQASGLDLDRERFGEDLAALSDGQQEGPEVLLSQYDAVKLELRKRILEGSLADHGKVFVGLDWRVDNVASSDRGAGINADVILLTLRYREGERLERITLQLTPESLNEIKLFTERIDRQAATGKA
jgi:hypothetical protein